MPDYINFAELSNKIQFDNFLNWLNIPYTEKNGELKGEINDQKFIVNKSKNLFFSPANDSFKGSVINFYASLTNSNLRDAANKLIKEFLDTPKPPKREMPNLELHYTPLLTSMFNIPEHVAINHEVGLVKQKSIMSGRIAFKCYDENKEVAGYIGWHLAKKNWFFPQNFKRPLWNLHRLLDKTRVILTADPFDALYLISLEFPVLCLLGASMTEKQEELIVNNCKQVCVLHSNPDNIASRLFKKVFVKAPNLIKPIKDYSVEEIVAL